MAAEIVIELRLSTPIGTRYLASRAVPGCIPRRIWQNSGSIKRIRWFIRRVTVVHAPVFEMLATLGVYANQGLQET